MEMDVQVFFRIVFRWGNWWVGRGVVYYIWGIFYFYENGYRSRVEWGEVEFLNEGLGRWKGGEGRLIMITWLSLEFFIRE